MSIENIKNTISNKILSEDRDWLFGRFYCPNCETSIFGNTELLDYEYIPKSKSGTRGAVPVAYKCKICGKIIFIELPFGVASPIPYWNVEEEEWFCKFNDLCYSISLSDWGIDGKTMKRD